MVLLLLCIVRLVVVSCLFLGRVAGGCSYGVSPALQFSFIDQWLVGNQVEII